MEVFKAKLTSLSEAELIGLLDPLLDANKREAVIFEMRARQQAEDNNQSLRKSRFVESVTEILPPLLQPVLEVVQLAWKGPRK